MSSFVGGCASGCCSASGSGSLRAGHRVDHGIAAAQPGRGRLGRSTTRPARPVARSGSPSSAACSSRPTTTTRTRRKPLGGVVGRGPRLGGSRARARRALSRPSRARRWSSCRATAFVDAMRITYPIAAAFIVLAALVAWRWLPAHGHRRVRVDRGTGGSARDQRVRDSARRKCRGRDRRAPCVDGRRGGGRRCAGHRGALRARPGGAGAERPVPVGDVSPPTWWARSSSGSWVVVLAETLGGRPACCVPLQPSASAAVMIVFLHLDGGERAARRVDGDAGFAALYLLTSLVAGFAAVAAGIVGTRRVATSAGARVRPGARRLMLGWVASAGRGPGRARALRRARVGAWIRASSQWSRRPPKRRLERPV